MGLVRCFSQIDIKSDPVRVLIIFIGVLATFAHTSVLAPAENRPHPSCYGNRVREALLPCFSDDTNIDYG